jgi:hypothetical protein
MSDTRLDVVEERLDVLETEVASLKRNKPGRRAAVLTNLHQPGVCAMHEGIDSAECPNANVYRHQQGCRGTACVRENSEYYAGYRAKEHNGA